MPHLIIHYSNNLKFNEQELCTSLADTLCTLQDETGKKVFPTGGVRVFAYPAPFYAVADSSGDYGFIYLNLRMAKGRPVDTHKLVGDALTYTAKRFIAPLMTTQAIGLTVQVDEGHEVYDHKHSTLHPIFQPKS